MSLFNQSFFSKSLLTGLGLLAAAGASAMEQKAFDQAFDALPHDDPAARVTALQDLRYRWLMESFPERATYEGYPGVDDRWTDYSMDAIERRETQTRRLLSASRHIHDVTLPADEQLDYQLLYQDLLSEVKGYQFPDYLLPLNHMAGIQTNVPAVLGAMAHRSERDYGKILARLEKLPALVEQTETLMRKGLNKHITPPQITLRDLPAQIRALIPDDPKQSPLLKVFQQMPTSIAPAHRQRLQQRAYALYRKSLAPAWRELAEFVERDYIPDARVNIAFTSLPDGQRWYAYKVRKETTTELSPAEIYEIGIGEVKRIRAEMDKVIAKTGFQGDFKAFTDYLRTDPRFFYTDKAELLSGYRDIAKRIDGELPTLFRKLPRLPYGVKAIPSYSEKSQTTAYYLPGSMAAGRSGTFYANTYKLDSRPKWEMEALTAHEAVPGHHLQIALAQEQENLHPLRRITNYTAFVEGWGLYAESLGKDLGLYQDPYSEFGALTYDMWRAVRLVVDTGMNQLGWSRDQAIEYFMQNSAKPRHDVTVEIDRYLAWPGQALAYKLGQLKILELRARAEKKLGDNFDIRAFHEELLSAGALPLNVLETRMNRWIEAQGDNGIATQQPAQAEPVSPS
ncbi:DUF885 domain-containing protein [Microbulbifer sp. SAOS-129_SWC]|uniref:DUF885 domain-containing protein n=1 Tax=Microbulbifer sp. SAOS-129_SWC TaxID=3145235 RepID=UPI0032176A8D